MTDMRGQRRRSDARTQILNLLLGTLFNACMVGAVLEKTGRLTSSYFETIVFWFVCLVIFCVSALLLFMISSARKYLRNSWNDKESLLDTGRGVRKAFTELNWFSFLFLGVTLFVIWFIGLKLAALGLALAISSILLTASIIAEIGIFRASKI